MMAAPTVRVMAAAIGYIARPTADLISRIVATLEVSLPQLMGFLNQCFLKVAVCFHMQ